MNPTHIRDNDPERRGATYWNAVQRRGGHEYTGGPVEWEPAEPRICPGCSLCQPDPPPARVIASEGAHHAPRA